MKKYFALGLLVACGGGDASSVVEVPPTQPLPPPPAVTVVVAQPTAPPSGMLNPGEEWLGRYTCAQGQTDLMLHINSVVGDQVEAVFNFEHDPSGAGGAYVLRGSISDSGRVVLVPERWLRRPSGYVMVGMTGDVRGTRFSGRIDNASCGGFDLRHR